MRHRWLVIEFRDDYHCMRRAFPFQEIPGEEDQLKEFLFDQFKELELELERWRRPSEFAKEGL